MQYTHRLLASMIYVRISTLQTFCFSLSSVSYTLLRLLNELSSHKPTKSELKNIWRKSTFWLTPSIYWSPFHIIWVVGVVLTKFDGCSQGAAWNSWRQSCAAAVQWGKGKAWGQSFAASSSSKLPPLITGHLLKSGHVLFNFSLAPLQPAKNKSVKFFT